MVLLLANLFLIDLRYLLLVRADHLKLRPRAEVDEFKLKHDAQ